MTGHTPMSKAGRLDVISSGARRRRTLEEEQRIVAEKRLVWRKRRRSPTLPANDRNKPERALLRVGPRTCQLLIVGYLLDQQFGLDGLHAGAKKSDQMARPIIRYV
jgi:hypothetical protein